MLYITVTFRLVHLGPALIRLVTADTMHSIEQWSPSRGHHLFITDDLPIAVDEAAQNKARTEVVMIHPTSARSKTHVNKKVWIIPLSKVNLSDEISAIIHSL